MTTIKTLGFRREKPFPEITAIKMGEGASMCQKLKVYFMSLFSIYISVIVISDGLGWFK